MATLSCSPVDLGPVALSSVCVTPFVPLLICILSVSEASLECRSLTLRWVISHVGWVKSLLIVLSTWRWGDTLRSMSTYSASRLSALRPDGRLMSLSRLRWRLSKAWLLTRAIGSDIAREARATGRFNRRLGRLLNRCRLVRAKTPSECLSAMFSYWDLCIFTDCPFYPRMRGLVCSLSSSCNYGAFNCNAFVIDRRRACTWKIMHYCSSPGSHALCLWAFYAQSHQVESTLLPL